MQLTRSLRISSLTHSTHLLDSRSAMPRPPHIVFAGGGTPANSIPGWPWRLMLSSECRTPMVTFVGSGRAAERHVVQAAGFRYVQLAVAAGAAERAARRAICDRQRGRLLGLAVVPARAARVAGRRVGRCGECRGGAGGRRPRHSDRDAGAERRAEPRHALAGPSATTVCAGFEETAPHLPVVPPLVVTGNPARPAFERLYRSEAVGGRRSERQTRDCGLRTPSHERDARSSGW